MKSNTSLWAEMEFPGWKYVFSPSALLELVNLDLRSEELRR
jgi:hypothetical protein